MTAAGHLEREPAWLLPSLGLGDVLRERGRSYPASYAVVCGTARLRYPELDSRVDGLACGLASLGVQAGDRVLWLGLNCHRLFETMLAAARLGAVSCPANWRLREHELRTLLADLAPAAVICQPDALDTDVVAACRAATAGAAWIWAPTAPADPPSGTQYEDLLQLTGSVPQPPVDDREPALAIYTAAFGGQPKAALLTHSGIIAHSLSLALAQQLTSEAVYLNCGPMFHMGTLMSTFATLLVGGKNVFIPRLDPQAVVAAIAAERCTRGFFPAPVLGSIADAARAAGLHLDSLLVDASQHELRGLGTEDMTPWGRRPGGYGQTEVTAILTASAFAEPGQAGGYGRAIPVAEVAIIDDTGRELPQGQPGEIAARGPTIAAGYLGHQPEFDERLAGRWYRTNDLGRREPDGTVMFLGPIGRLIKSGGENVYPAEIEQCVRGLTEIADVHVLGMPDERWGERVVAVIVPAEGYAEEAAAGAADGRWRATLASYKRPREIRATTAITRDSTGRPDDSAARKLFR